MEGDNVKQRGTVDKAKQVAVKTLYSSQSIAKRVQYIDEGVSELMFKV